MHTIATGDALTKVLGYFWDDICFTVRRVQVDKRLRETMIRRECDDVES